MAGVVIRMKLAMMANGVTGWRAWRMFLGGLLGLAAALGTVWLGTLDLGRTTATTELLGLALAGWTLGWLLGPILLGGNDETLRPEYFRTLPISTRKLAGGLLAGAVAGLPAVLSVVALGALLPFAERLGPAALLVALLAMALHLLLMVLLARVTVAALGEALRTRLGMELVPLLISIGIGVVVVAGLVLWDPLTRQLGLLAEGRAPELPSALPLVPSSWGAVAVEAAGRRQWPIALAGLTGLAALDAGLLALWVVLLRRRLTRRATAGRARRPSAQAHRVRLMARTPTGAALVRALRGWQRDAGMHIVVVATLGMAVVYAVISGVGGWPYFLVLAGPLALLVAANESANLFGFEGSALWHTLVIPDSARPEVRGRQLAWLLVFGPMLVAVTAACLVLAGPAPGPLRPLAIAGLPALLGVGSGLVVFFSVFTPYPVGMDHPVGGSGKSLANPIRHALVPLLILSALPTAFVTVTGTALGSPALVWAGIGVGVATGVFGAWLGGRLAYQRLRVTGPELLAKLASR